jgi:hypothetical protein
MIIMFIILEMENNFITGVCFVVELKKEITKTLMSLGSNGINKRINGNQNNKKKFI